MTETYVEFEIAGNKFMAYYLGKNSEVINKTEADKRNLALITLKNDHHSFMLNMADCEFMDKLSAIHQGTFATFVERCDEFTGFKVYDDANTKSFWFAEDSFKSKLRSINFITKSMTTKPLLFEDGKFYFSRIKTRLAYNNLPDDLLIIKMKKQG